MLEHQGQAAWQKEPCPRCDSFHPRHCTDCLNDPPCADQAREIRDNIVIEHGIRPHPMRVRYRVFDERGKMTHHCPECGNPTTYQAFSGGTEWYCDNCQGTGAYPEGQAPRRAELLKTEAGRVALRAEMDQELARLRHKEGN